MCPPHYGGILINVQCSIVATKWLAKGCENLGKKTSQKVTTWKTNELYHFANYVIYIKIFSNLQKYNSYIIKHITLIYKNLDWTRCGPPHIQNKFSKMAGNNFSILLF